MTEKSADQIQLKKNDNKLENKSDKITQNSTQREKAIENIKKN